MQATLPLTQPDSNDHPADHRIAPQLQRAEIFRDYRQAFETTTGLPLALRPVGSFQSPLHASKKVNAFCALMAAGNQTCAACLRMQQRMENEAASGPRTFECFAGLAESAVPVRAGGAVVGHLQTGQVLLRPPTQARFNRVFAQLTAWGAKPDRSRLEAAYFQTRVIARRQFEAVVHLLGVFAQHLGAFGNQVMVMERASESPVVARARAFIAGHHGEALSLAAVSRAVNMSAFYFCKVFKKATGLTFTDYVARVRIEAVRQILLNPHKRVSEAAYEAGFQSLSQFNRTFRRIAGESPSAYRERLHGRGAGAPLSAWPHAA